MGTDVGIWRSANIRRFGYWVSTAGVAIAVGGAGAAQLLRDPGITSGLAHLGYPGYFATILGTWEVVGALAILAPGLSRVKEWAYAGMVFALSGAALSHAASGDPAAKILVPVGLLGATLVSRASRTARAGSSRALRESFEAGRSREMASE